MNIDDFNQRVINTGATGGIALFVFIAVNSFWGPFPKAEKFLYSPLGVISFSAGIWLTSPFIANALKKTPKLNMLWVLVGAIVIIPVTHLLVSILR